ncbi:MAG TPA: helicase-related protein [Pirellulales bacterium]|jgi:preprotein translocase subunit SecA|nr:helicase-related protein [Pirellulales bacterium]
MNSDAWATISERLQARLQAFSQAAIRRRLARWQQLLPTIAGFEPELMALGDQELLKRSLGMRYRAKSQEPLDRLLPEAFALVREAARRKVGMRHFDVQMLGGIAIHHRSIAEMQTGEGKTLTASLPLYLQGLAGKGALLATVNDYLAGRDAQQMRPIFEVLGMTVGVIESKMQQVNRRKAYACDVTYGTSKEFGFDFLRDKLLERRIDEGQSDFLGGMLGHTSNTGGDKPVQRAPHFILVDEADSILIDEARTPLIISALPTEAQRIAVESYKWAAEAADQFVEDQHYEYDHEKRSVELTAEGRRLVRELPKPAAMHAVGMFPTYEYAERAIKVARDFTRDRQYVVLKGEIVIVDEFTGRIAEGRKWRDGIHQAVEAKEEVEVTVETGQAARVTVQDYFLLYPHLGGMTGTASNSAAEMRKIYRLQVVPIPTNRPAIRERMPERIFGTSEGKWETIADEVAEMHSAGRPVLIGTRSIDKSEIVAELLTARGITHQVLNAHHIASEAEIVAQAGQHRRVTVSTNMAGRGTDIKLGPGVVELGGLHVILTEMHDSSRIDRQLIGRCGRQGDPGTYRQYLSLDDELLMGLGPERADDLKAIGEEAHGNLDRYTRLFRQAQRQIEQRHFRDRRILMYHEKERRKMQIQMGQNPYLDTPG